MNLYPRQLLLEGHLVTFDLYPDEQMVVVSFAGYMADALLNIEKGSVQSFKFVELGEEGYPIPLFHKINRYLEIICAEWMGKATLAVTNDKPIPNEHAPPVLKIVKQAAK